MRADIAAIVRVLKMFLARKPPKRWRRRVRCSGRGYGNGGCGLRVRVSERDLFRTAYYGCDMYPEYFAAFRCPSCGALTDVDYNGDPSKLPKDPKGEMR